jgi:hypothetical protein
MLKIAKYLDAVDVSTSCAVPQIEPSVATAGYNKNRSQTSSPSAGAKARIVTPFGGLQ